MKPKRHDLILHIGHYKTGTTALQVFLERNRRALARGGLVYAHTSVKNSKHSPLAFALLRDAGVTSLLYGFDDPRTAPEIWSTLFDEARALPRGAALLVSSEEFMRLGAHPPAARLLRRILAGAPDIRVRVIAYLRPPQAHLRSWYNQMVKLGHPVAGFEAAVRSQFETVHLDYAAAIDPWIALCGAQAVTLRGFDDGLRQGDALYRDFLDTLGVAMPRRAVLPGADPNPRLDDRLLPLRRMLNHADLPRPMTDRIMQQAMAALATLDGPGGGDGIAAIRATARAGIERLASLPGAGFDARTLLTDLPQPEPDSAGDRDVAAMMAVLTAEIAQLRLAQRRTLGRLAAIERHLGLGDGSDET